jgi:bifunctional DNase/RNase
MGASVSQILVSDLRDDVFYARIIVDINGRRLEIDSRPSDAIALAVRVRVPIFVEDDVMEKAAITPEEEVEAEGAAAGDERLDAFTDFVDSLNLDDLEGSEE